MINDAVLAVAVLALRQVEEVFFCVVVETYLALTEAGLFMGG